MLWIAMRTVSKCNHPICPTYDACAPAVHDRGRHFDMICNCVTCLCAVDCVPYCITIGALENGQDIDEMSPTHWENARAIFKSMKKRRE